MNVKREMLCAILERAWAYIEVDASAPGVLLPGFLGRGMVTLQIGHDMPVPIEDLAIDDHGVSGTMSFQRSLHFCRAPWTSIRMMCDVDGRGAVFEEVALPLDERAFSLAAVTDAAGDPDGVLDGPAQQELWLEEADADGPVPPRPQRGAHLRLVR